MRSDGTHAHHDRLSIRLSQLLLRLQQGEQLRLADLATQFGVSLRTLQRDIHRIELALPLERTPQGGYRLDTSRPAALPPLRELERFARVSGLEGLYPRFDPDFVRDLLQESPAPGLRVHGPSYEDVQPRRPLFEQLRQAIQAHRRISFVYSKTEGDKTVTVQPYELRHHHGVWYLAALDQQQLKAYSIGKISRLLVLPDTFQPATHIQQMLHEEDSIWLNQNKIEVVLEVAREAAGYFRRRQLIAGQMLKKEQADGGIIVSAKVAHINQILPIVRYWIPHVRIINPPELQIELDQQLRDYLENKGTLESAPAL